jgi:ParB family transcriptional regulator, chromosome partitioning protein
MTTAVEKTEKVPDKRRALGRGLESLLPGPRVVAPAVRPIKEEVATEVAGAAPGVVSLQASAESTDAVVQIPLEQIDPNPYQTRSTFDFMAMNYLADSIRSKGVVQPITVRPGADGRYVLVLGERRLRASKLAQTGTIPAIIRVVNDQQAAELTVIENLQRQDLDCVDQAAAYMKLSTQFDLTQEEISERMGVSRESVANYMRILRLPAKVIEYLHAGKLGFSEARVLSRMIDAERIQKYADQVVEKGMSVKQLEASLVRPTTERPRLGARWQDPNVRAAQTELERVLGVRVKIRDRRGKGQILIEYGTLEDFDRVLGMLKGK